MPHGELFVDQVQRVALLALIGTLTKHSSPTSTPRRDAADEVFGVGDAMDRQRRQQGLDVAMAAPRFDLNLSRSNAPGFAIDCRSRRPARARQ